MLHINAKRSYILAAALLAALIAVAPAAAEPLQHVYRSMDDVPLVEGAYTDAALANELIAGMDLDHSVIGTLRSKTVMVAFVDKVVDDVARWYEKMLGYPSLTLEDLSVMEGLVPGNESPIYYAYEYYHFPDNDAYDETGRLIWPGTFITRELAANRRTWMRGAILQTASYGWFFKDMNNSVTDVILSITDVGFDFRKMTYSKKTAIVLSWEVYEPYSGEALPDEATDPEYDAWIRDVEEFAEMLMADPPTPKMLDVPIFDQMMFDPYTTAMNMMEGEPMYTFFWDVTPEDAVRIYSQEMKLTPMKDDYGWVFVFAGRLPWPMHALYIYPNDIPGVPFKTVVYVRRENVSK